MKRFLSSLALLLLGVAIGIFSVIRFSSLDYDDGFFILNFAGYEFLYDDPWEGGE